MSRTDSDRGFDRSDLADADIELRFRKCFDRDTAPLDYEVAVHRGGRVEVVTFSCNASLRIEKMKELGIDPENEPVARRSRKHRGEWTPPIGDPTLCAEFNDH